MKVGNIIVKTFTQNQAKAVADAQEVFDALKSSDSNNVKVLNLKLLKACTEFLNGGKGSCVEIKTSRQRAEFTVAIQSADIVLEQGAGTWHNLVELGNAAWPWIAAGGAAIVAGATDIAHAIGDAAGAVRNFIHPADPNAADRVQPEGEADSENERKKGKESDEISEESDYRKQSDEQLLKSKQSYEKLIKEHEKKLEDYKKDPYSYDKKNILKNALNDKIREKIIKGRIVSLKKQIAKQRKEL